MSILHVIPSANPAAGGPIEAVTRLGIEFRRLGSTVEIVTLDDPQAEWVKNYPLPCHALGPGFLKYGYTRRLVPWLRHHAAAFDIIVVNGLWQYTGFGSWRALKAMRRPYVVFTHGMLDPWFTQRYPLKHLKKWLYWPWAEYRILRDASVVLFTSEEERRLARKSFWLYRATEQVVNYGTAAPPDDDGSQREAFSKQFPHLEGKRLMLFFGRIHEKKGCDLLVRAFGSLLERNGAIAESWRLVLAGPVASAAYGRSLERLIRKTCPDGSVAWTGLLTGDAKWGAFYSADVFVLPSHQENFGVAVAESLGCGVPVLISNKVNIWREIADDGAGFVENDDQAGTGTLLSKWVALDDAARRQMAANARSSFAKRFDVRDTATRLTATLEAVR